MRPASARLLAALLPAALSLAVPRCGGQPGQGGSFSLDLYTEAALPEPIASFQVEMLTNGKQYDCQVLEAACLVTQVRRDQLVTLTDSAGKNHPAIVFPSQVTTDGGTQDVTVTATVGADYKLIVEALSTDTPPRLAGTSCTSLPDGIHPGANKVLAEPMKLDSPPLACDPRWE